MMKMNKGRSGESDLFWAQEVEVRLLHSFIIETKMRLSNIVNS
jgi:hypothetical protein